MSRRSLDRREALWLAAATVGYFALTSVLAIRKPFWYDEFFTIAAADLPRWSDLGRFFDAGSDSNPPLIYILVRLSRAVFGAGEWATRLPSILAYWMFCLALFEFCRRRLEKTAAWVALLLPLTCSSYIYAYEARPYALVLAGVGWTLVIWQRVGETGQRRWALIGLVIALCVAVSSHYYAPLAIAPIAAGEAVRAWRQRRLDWPVWLSFAVPAALLAAYLPWIRATRRAVVALWVDSDVFWARPRWESVGLTYFELFLPALIPILPGYILLLMARRKQKVPAEEGGFPGHELVAIIGLATLPLWVFLLGKFALNTYMARYALAVVAGVTIVITLAVAREAKGQARPAALLAGVIVVWSIGNSVHISLGFQPPEQAATALLAQIPRDESPVAVASPLRFVQLAHYAPAPVRERFLFLNDPASAQRLPDFIPELALPSLVKWVPLRVEPYAAASARLRRMLVYSVSDTNLEWLPDRLAREGWKVQVLAAQGKHRLLSAAAPVQ